MMGGAWWQCKPQQVFSWHIQKRRKKSLSLKDSKITQLIYLLHTSKKIRFEKFVFVSYLSNSYKMSKTVFLKLIWTFTWLPSIVASTITPNTIDSNLTHTVSRRQILRKSFLRIEKSLFEINYFFRFRN